MSTLPAAAGLAALPVRAGVRPSANTELSAGVSQGYGVMSIKGKAWTARKGGLEKLQYMSDGITPKSYIDVVIVKSSPVLSKTWYQGGYDANNQNKHPDCASTDGIRPKAGVPLRQAEACAICPQNAWGSGKNQDGTPSKGKACQDGRRIAIVPVDDIENEAWGGPMLVKIPPASLKGLTTLASQLNAAGYDYYEVAIRLRFDPTAATPLVLYEVGNNPETGNAALSPAQVARIKEMRESEIVRHIIEESAEPDVSGEAAQPVVSGLDRLPPRAAVAAALAPAPAPASASVTLPVTAAPVVEAESPQVAALKAQLAALQAQQVAPVPAPAPEAPKPVEVAPTLAPASAPAPTTQAEVSFDDALAQLLGD